MQIGIDMKSREKVVGVTKKGRECERCDIKGGKIVKMRGIYRDMQC